MFLEILDTIGNLLFVIIFIGLCIFIHELGHFLAAKWRGLHVDAFSIGFKKIWGKKINGVEYRIGCLPFGGYVELPQVDGTDAVPHAADGTELPPAKPLDRMITAVAGPLFNIIFGLFLACFIWIFGMPMPPDAADLQEFRVLTVEEGSPEYEAGLRPGDVIVSFDGDSFRMSWMDMIQEIMLQPGLDVKLGVRRERSDEIISIEYIASCGPNKLKPQKLEDEGMPYPYFTVALPLEFHPEPGSNLTEIGMQEKELIYAVNGKPQSSLGEFIHNLYKAAAEPVTFSVIRDDKIIDLPPIQLEPNGEPYYQAGIIFRQEGGNEIANLFSDGPAYNAGIRPGDKVVALGGKEITDIETFRAVMAENKEAPIVITVLRNGENTDFEITPDVFVAPVLQGMIASRGYPTPFEQLSSTITLSLDSLRGMLIYLGNKLHLTETESAIKPRNMSGIVGMANILFTASSTSFMTGLYFVVVVCFALALFNILPLPVLDGGHTFFALVELICRRPLPRRLLKVLTCIFVIILIGFMIYVTFYDVKRLVKDIVPDSPAAEIQEDSDK